MLRKPGPLTEQELEQIRRHPVTGARLVESFDDFEAALPYVLHHHERWDGFGYPHGLSGDGDSARGDACSASPTRSTR